MEFILHKDQSFEVGHVDINGVSMNQLVTQAILEKVLDSYKKNRRGASLSRKKEF